MKFGNERLFRRGLKLVISLSQQNRFDHSFQQQFGSGVGINMHVTIYKSTLRYFNEW